MNPAIPAANPIPIIAGIAGKIKILAIGETRESFSKELRRIGRTKIWAEIVRNKINLNAGKYPIHKAKGTSEKYTEL